MRRRSLLAFAALPFGAARAQPAAWPSRPIRIIVPFAPGGSGDITARLIGAHVEARAGQPVVVETRPGANGVVGMLAAKQSPPDGHTLVVATTSTHAANAAMMRALPYDPERDFVTVGFYASNGSYLVVRPEAPYRTARDIVAAARARPGQVTYGHFNASSQVPGAMLGAMADVQVQGVPYRAIGTAFADLMAGRLDFIFVDTTAGDAFLRQGQVRALAVTRDGRWGRFPDLPAMSETWPDFVLTGFLGLAVPAGTPAEVAQRLNALVNEAIMAEPTRSRLQEFGFNPEPLDLPRIAAAVRAEREKWARFVRTAGIEPE
jgi:tripartite-type tricarboxylate transporter receptor subunit TctC